MAVYDAQTQAKLDELGRLWNQATNSGNGAQAESYHQQANTLRDNAGLKAGVDYDTTSGALLSSSSSPSLSSYAKDKGLGLDYNTDNNMITLTKDGNTYTAPNGSIQGLTLGSDNHNYVSNPTLFNTSIASLFKTSETPKPNDNNKTPAPTQPQPQSGSNLNDVIQSLNSWWSSVQNSITKPTQSTVSYQQVLSDLQNQLNPLHQQKLQELQAGQADAERALAAEMAGSGAYDSSTRDKRLASLKGQYLTGAADEDAQYEANVAQLANSVYQAGLSRDTSSQQSYDAIIANLAQAYMNGTLDITRMELDDAYRQAQLAQAAQDSYLNNFGQVA